MQTADRDPSSLSAAEIDVTDGFGEPGKPLALQIELPPQTLSGQFFVGITGIPGQFTVSPGVRSGTSWLLAARELNGLTITAPESFNGRFPINVRLFDSEHKIAATGTAFITIRDRKISGPSTGAWNAADETQPRKVSPSQPVPESPARSMSITPEDEALQLKRSEQFLKSGDISAARLILETLVDQGSGQGAHALGTTYDPIFFKSNFIRGMAPDPAKAAFWYRKAIELGYKEEGKESGSARLQANK
jgi:hypothetical protein